MKQRFWVPEVLQTSSMDCGPAALKALFSGFGTYVSYPRLRELCHTDVDGTSIDTLEEIASALGLEVEQHMLPLDLLWLDARRHLPAIVVTRLPDGGTHFVVAWRVVGDWVQIMDPAAGRLWMRRERFAERIYLHEQRVPRAAWLEWAGSEVFASAREERMTRLGAPPRVWEDPAHQDAALRLAGELRARGGLARGAEAAELLELSRAEPERIPDRFWAVRSEDDPNLVLLRGAVLVTARGPNAEFAREGLSEALRAALDEPPPSPWRALARGLGGSGWALAAVGATLVASALTAVLEALLLRGMLDIDARLALRSQRLLGSLGLLALLLCGLLLALARGFALRSLGRRLELHLRVSLLERVPRLGARYFQSRLVSDLAYRAHWVKVLRELPALGAEIAFLVLSLVVTSLAIAWFFPGSLACVLGALGLGLGIPLAFGRTFLERDLRVRELDGVLSNFHLEALLGKHAIEAHAARRSLLRLFAPRLEDWALRSSRFHRAVFAHDALQLGLSAPPILLLMHQEWQRAHSPGGLLLLAYWACSIPLLANHLALLFAGLPGLHNTLVRLLEPLTARAEPVPGDSKPSASRSVQRGVELQYQEVEVALAGQRILGPLDLRIARGEHVAVVGPSGTGKSTFAGLLLGWHAPASGVVRVAGAPLDQKALRELRAHTAWIDPDVRLFRAHILDNLRYGNSLDAPLGAALTGAELGDVLERVPHGLQTHVGDNGTLLSGGEGQRVRIGRALLREPPRLAVLDEPTRGLDARARSRFLDVARRHFAEATLLYVTHHVTDTLGFDRVLFIEEGNVVESGSPDALRKTPGSRYARWLERERFAEERVWRGSHFQHYRLQSGELLRDGNREQSPSSVTLRKESSSA